MKYFENDISLCGLYTPLNVLTTSRQLLNFQASDPVSVLPYRMSWRPFRSCISWDTVRLSNVLATQLFYMCL